MLENFFFIEKKKSWKSKYNCTNLSPPITIQNGAEHIEVPIYQGSLHVGDELLNVLVSLGHQVNCGLLQVGRRSTSKISRYLFSIFTHWKYYNRRKNVYKISLSSILLDCSHEGLLRWEGTRSPSPMLNFSFEKKR